MNPTVKKILIGAGVLVLLFLIGNFGLNWWLKNNLPNYVKNNSDYKISYKKLDVDLGTGNIMATSLAVASKNPANTNVIGLDGTVDSLQISRLGIYDALFNKRVNSSDLILVKPNLKVTLAKPVDEKTGKERNPVVFKNITIKDGNIVILRHTKQKFLSVNDLRLNVSNLQMTEKSVENKLPVVFDKYEINGKNFFFRPDNVYALKASTVSTKNGLMNIRNFQLVPLLSYAHFVRAFPNKGAMFQFAAKEMNFQDILLKDNRISLSNASFVDPDLKMYTSKKQQKKQKDFKYDVELEGVKLTNAKVEILRPDQTKLFGGTTLNLDIKKLHMDEETVKGNIPFSYEKFRVDGRNVYYSTPSQTVTAAALALNQKSGDLRNLSFTPGNGVGKTTIAGSARQLQFNTNEWRMEEGKLKMDGDFITLNGFNGTITAPSTAPQNNGKKADYSKIEFPLTFKKINVRNSSITYNKGETSIGLGNLNANLSNLEMNAETAKSGIPFKSGAYSLTTSSIKYRLNRYYQLSAGQLKYTKGQLQVNNVHLQPLVSRSEFIRMIPSEKDLYTLRVNSVAMSGSWDLISPQKNMNVSQLTINGMDANIFRSKLPKDDTTVKPMYSELLRRIKFPMYIANTDIRNSVLVYEEDTKKSDGPGKLTFGNFNMNVKNLNSGKMQGKPTAVPITINTSFMNISPMKVNWSFDTANMADAFTIAGSITSLPTAGINPFIEPYLNIRATGNIQSLSWNFKGNKAGLNGTMNMKHTDLNVSILQKNSNEENKLLSALANMVVRTDSGKYPESVVVDNVKRDPTKSFFNLFWQGIQEGLKKTLIGNRVEKTEKAVKNAQQAVKDIKKDVKDAKQELKADKTAAPEPKKKSGGLRNLFRKKEKAEN